MMRDISKKNYFNILIIYKIHFQIFNLVLYIF
jgi:hypothetical protein